MPERTILLGTASIETVETALRSLSTESCTLLVNDKTLSQAKRFCPAAKGFGCGMLAEHPWKLFRLLMRYRPSRIVVVSGPIFYHYKLMETIELFMKLTGLGKSRLQVWKNACFIDHPRSLGPRNLLADVGVMAVLAVIVAPIILFSSLNAWLAILGCIAAYELLLRFNHPPTKEIPQATPGKIECKTERNGNRTRGTLRIANSGVSHDFNYTYIERGLGRHRVTSRESKFAGRPEIALLGASVTVGAYLEDAETYGWLLQKQFPQFEIKNYARSGNTTYDQLWKLRRLLQKKTPPKVVVALYAPNLDRKLAPDYHSVQYQKLLQPHWRMTDNGIREMSGKGYTPWFMGKTYLGWNIHHFLMRLYIRCILESATHIELSRHCIDLMREECAVHGVELVVATAFGCGSGRSYLNQKGFNWVDCCRLQDGSSMEDSLEKWTMFPFDAHPNASANAIFAQRIGAVISACRNGRSGVVQQACEENSTSRSAFAEHLDVYPLF